MSVKSQRGLGARVRAIRRKQGLTQAKLAELLGISGSYLNLIEHDRRSLTAPLLLRLASLFDLRVEEFSLGQDPVLVADLMDAFSDEVFEDALPRQADVREFVASTPELAEAVLGLYRAYVSERQALVTLGSRLADGEDPLGMGRKLLPNEEVNDELQRYSNYFPALEERAAELVEASGLSLTDPYSGLSRHLNASHSISLEITTAAKNGGALRRYDPAAGRIVLAEELAPRSRNFQLASQLALLEAGDLIEQLTASPRLSTEESRDLFRVALSSYFAGAVLMPYRLFLDACTKERYDVEAIGHRFRTSFEQVCHRMTTLQRPGESGVPFHMIRVDIAGNISKRFSASGIHFARFSGACPRWNVHTAFLTPDAVRVQISTSESGTLYFCFARTIRRAGRGYHSAHPIHAIGMGCTVEHAQELVYSDGIDLAHLDRAVPIGVTCRLCSRTDCDQRAFPALQQRLQIDPNVRSVSSYSTGE